MDGLYATARAAWPQLDVDETRFATHLGALPGDDLAVADIYLSIACADGNPAALAILDGYFADLRPTLSRMGLTPTAIDETLQIMREELLVARPGAPPRILNYGGRGHLRGWLRSVAARTGLRGRKHPHRETELDDQTPSPAGGDLELEYMKKKYGDVFQRAFGVALSEQDTDDRLLLKQRFRHHLTVEELGELYGVHAGTISRRVAAARERLVKATRTHMMKELGVGKDDVSSILRMIQSELEITLSTKESL